MMEELPDRLRPLLKHLSLTKGPGLAAWARVAERVQRVFRFEEITRRSALTAAGVVDAAVDRLLTRHGFDWLRLAQEIGFPPIQHGREVPPDDGLPNVTLDPLLRRAIGLYRQRASVQAALTPTGVAWCVLASVAEDPEAGVLPSHLGSEALARIDEALKALEGDLVLKPDESRVRADDWEGNPDWHPSTSSLGTPTESPLRAETQRSGERRSSEADAEKRPEPSPPGVGPPLLFISYSHRDRKWRDRLREELEPYVAAGRIAVWDDGDLRAGEDWQTVLEEVRNRAAGSILLVSPDYLGSGYIRAKEIPHLLYLQGQGHRLFPLLVRESPWDAHDWLSRLQIFPRGPTALAEGMPEEVQSLLAEFARTVADVVGIGSDQAAVRPPSVESRKRSEQEVRVPAHTDDPSLVDELGRRPFAEVIARRIQEVSESPGGEDRAFMVQVHGPWGSGKTSVLNFMREQLQGGGLGARWVVVELNAWQNEKVRPPWWALIREVYAQAVHQLRRDGWWPALKLRARWLLWRLRVDWFPAILALAAIAVVGFLVTQFLELSPGDDLGEKVKLWFGVVAAAMTLGATVFAASRTLVLGSSRAAKTYLDLSRDPMRPIATLFGRLIRGIGRPVVIFIDDLDRCPGDYVVELLEGIQTLFREAPVTYVVAADRNWICTSFEKHHEDFTALGDPGRPLGHLFLEKMFQVSATVPEVSSDARSEYWMRLLQAGVGPAPEEVERASEQAEEEAWRILGDADSEEELQQVIDEHGDDAVLQQGLRAAASKRITAPEARRRTEHRLLRYASYLEPNPRAMKRLVNAYGIRQAVAFLEGRDVDPDVMALWTIVEMRWPLLADLLAERPELVAQLRDGKAPAADDRLPVSLLPLFGDEAVQRILRCKVRDGDLGEEQIRSVVGVT